MSTTGTDSRDENREVLDIQEVEDAIAEMASEIFVRAHAEWMNRPLENLDVSPSDALFNVECYARQSIQAAEVFFLELTKWKKKKSESA